MKTSSAFASTKASKSQKAAPEPPPSRSVMVRSLRRRLWKALQDEDVTSAIRAYTSTKTDYEEWLDEEIDEEQRLLDEKNSQRLKERRPKRSMSLRKLGMGKMPSARWTSSRNLGVSDTRKTQFLEAKYGSALPILQTEFHPNDAFERDDFYGPQDSYDIELLSPPPPPPPPKVKRSRPKRRGPRLAGFSMLWSRNYTAYGPNFFGEGNMQSREDSKDEGEKVDENMTTLMHEATRIACPDFVRLLLSQGGNPNVRNGQMRTALHMVGGGMVRQEIRFSNSQTDVGIRVPVVDLNEDNGDDNDERRGKKAARAVGRLFQKLKDGSTADTADQPGVLSTTQSDDDFGQLTSKRMDTLLVILSWVHHDDGTPSSGEGPSINSVDARGRTALHYAAELGRSDLCLTILTSFGAILTIVDESGQTPGELAAAETHPELAAQLEARALLYIDPYGLDEELMASVWGGTSDDERSNGDGKKKKKRKRSAHSKLAPPFSWFETWKTDKVRMERELRVKNLTTQMQEALATKQELRESTDFMYNHGIDDSEEERTLNSDQAVTPKRTSKIHVNNTGENAIRVEVEVPETLFEESESKPAFRLPRAEANNETDGTAENTAEDSDAPPIQLVTVELPEQDTESEVKKQSDDDDDDVEAKMPLEIVVEPPESEVVAAESLSELQILSKKLQPADVHRYAAAHSWNLAEAMSAFQEDPFGALKEAGIEINVEEEPKPSEEEAPADGVQICLICCDEFETDSERWVNLSACDHAFCSDCLGVYISECDRSKETGVAMNCPHHECHVPLSPEEVEKLAPSKDVYESLLQTSDEDFVANAEDLGFCPHPGCNGVVRRIMPSFVASAKLDRNLLNLAGAVCTACGDEESEDNGGCPLTYEGVRDPNYMMTRNSVQPKRAHRFCFSCGSDHMHWPVQCETLDAWKEKISEEIGELEEVEEGAEGDSKHFNDVAQRLWMKANTRPCPKCKVPIEKNDGCNHMTCSNRSCRHEFCWICREDWKLHNTETGGFFRCNRWQGDDNHKYYDTPPPPEQRVPDNNDNTNAANANTNTSETLSSEVNYGTSLHSSRVAWKKAKEMGLFLHHYRRWTAHSESATLERAMADSACSRLSAVVEAAVDLNGTEEFDFGGKGLSFVHAAFTELLECRSLLQYSYVFAYFRYPIQYHIRRNRLTKSKEREKSAFEQLQSELEMLTEQMSDIVARKHLRATQMQIMFLTTGACQKRSELTSFMLSLLNEQLKEAKEEEERAKREKNRSTVDRTPHDIGSIFDFPPRDFGARPYHHHHHHHYHPRYPHHHRDHVSSRLRRLMDTQYNRRTPFYDSDDDEDFHHMRPVAGRSRLDRSDEDATQDALRASVHAFFQMGSDDFSNDNDMPPGRFQDWACTECTYMNAGGRRCAMCGTARR